MATKILVADDSATMRRVLEMTFAGEEAQVVTVGSGEAALTSARDFAPDVVFADASMEGMDGYELAKQIKAEPSLASAAVIVMASQQVPYDEGRGRDAGVDDHIAKPFETQSVIDRVGQVLAQPRAAAAAPAGQPAGTPAAPPGPPPPPATAAAPPAPSAARSSVAGQPARPAAPRPSSAQATVAGIGSPAAAPPPTPAAAARPAAAPAAAKADPAPAAPRPAPAAPAAPKPAPETARAPAADMAAPVAAATAAGSPLAERLDGLGLTKEQVDGVLALSREVIEQVVWEVVPDLAEVLIKEEIRRLTAE